MTRASSGLSNTFVVRACLLLFAKALTHAVTRLSSIARDEVLLRASDPRSTFGNGTL
jgi:hypothetical protein